MCLAGLFLLGTTYVKENLVSDLVSSLTSVNDEYDSFLPLVMAEHDPKADVELNRWKDKTYTKHSYIQRPNGFVEEYYDELLCNR
jgi:hypothetical protein